MAGVGWGGSWGSRWAAHPGSLRTSPGECSDFKDTWGSRIPVEGWCPGQLFHSVPRVSLHLGELALNPPDAR